ncbi:hypothetical protein TARUN_2152 [Trichoderma arundinaceum]|uniref:Xylanolytic transcriptional activator regulatory domain-containing protein n=1 Tax=Trichoderma arundinaceum TaxID=490622 RepID=A0A395NVH6_TRIAR|nr:hypothetical protein TARUN_2152 [Trichoderma arundinaceum]
MCRAHGTECSLQESRQPRTSIAAQLSPGGLTPRLRRDTRDSESSAERLSRLTVDRSTTAGSVDPRSMPSGLAPVFSASPASPYHRDRASVPEPFSNHQRPLELDEAEDDSPHIICPAIASDKGFLDNYLASVQTGNGVIKSPLPGTTTNPVVFTRVQKRPIGLDLTSNPACSKLYTIEKFLEPWGPQVMDMYFNKANSCFPILNEASFRDRYANTRSRISPAVLACLYAHSLIYWPQDLELSRHCSPDGRFVWNLALEALYSELHLSPGISSIIATLLNIGGRPTTTMIGNGMLLGCAISLAHCLGLNRNPMPWDISEPEKQLRIQIWWCLLIHDCWSSFAYGTPPHIQRTHHDVPLPTRHYLVDGQVNDMTQKGQACIFEALASLSDVLASYLENLYSIRTQPLNRQDRASKYKLDAWIDSQTGDVRQIIIRGTNLDLPGAANLRLCFLGAKFFCRRAEMNEEAGSGASSELEAHVQVRRTVEEIVLFIQELSSRHLGDFWLPQAAFILSSAATFLIRFAVQSEIPSSGPSQSLSLRLAKDLVQSLRSHSECHGWELGDICLGQYAEIVQSLVDQETSEGTRSGQELTPYIADSSLFDSIMVDQWDPFLWADM